MTVALLAEGVDRNQVSQSIITHYHTSPSSRRAWIEITRFDVDGASFGVALLAEGVDRNCSVKMDGHTAGVALLAEGVDRNLSSTWILL